ncbi:unnamed protein product [Cylindrotheca closterium]|uniref:Fe2OG dioxygenase domain-containing protein n=1 Tax=Cylindrotheca closterium TaxID=2856 RepID=A0AAD2FS45_9STRA|nr:unnamed protein product [Cylindrotheca closterium]
MNLCYPSKSRGLVSLIDGDSYHHDADDDHKNKHHHNHHCHHHCHHHHRGTLLSSTTATQPPFLVYPSPTKLVNNNNNTDGSSSIYTTTPTAVGDTNTHHRSSIYPAYLASLSSSFSTSPRLLSQSSFPLADDASIMPAPYPRTPPPFPRRRPHAGTIVSPPAPLRISSSSHHPSSRASAAAQEPYCHRQHHHHHHHHKLQYETIGPAHLRTYRLLLPNDLIADCQLDPIVAHAEHFATNRLLHGWQTDLYSLTKQDIALRDIPGMLPLIQPIFDYVTQAIRTLYGCHEVVVDKNQPHILKYSVDSGHTGVQLHHDRCDVTANLALSRSGDYCGGGTYIRDTGSIIKLNYGECLLHPGSLVHGGMEVTKGTRYLMVTFAHLR